MRNRPLHRALVGTLLAGLLAACGADSTGDAASPVQGTAKAEPVAAESPPKRDPHSHERKERPLPAFGGWTLDGDRLEVSSLMGRRLMVFFFNPELDDADVVAEAVSRVAGERGKHNFEILGVAMASTGDVARAFVTEHGIDYRVLDDSNAAVASRLGLRTPLAILGVDAEGYVIFGLAQFAAKGPGAVAAIEEQLRTSLRLPEPDSGSPPGARPEAPGSGSGTSVGV